MTTITAHELYNIRELTEFCSGSDLSELFVELFDEPSPSDYVQLSRAHVARAKTFIDGCYESVLQNSGEGSEATRFAALAKYIFENIAPHSP